LVEESWINHPMESNPKVLRELECEDTRPNSFRWGYDGVGPSVSAAAILTDALGLGDSRAVGIAVDSPSPNEILHPLREAFCIEVIAQLCDEWRLRRSVVLRWARTWYLQCSITELPVALRELPPLPRAYQSLETGEYPMRRPYTDES
jgi:hypothetical protein